MNDGGPAFPIPGAVSHYDDGRFSDEAHVGISLRGYYAAKALPALIARHGDFWSPQAIAVQARNYADAMLSALEEA